MTFGNKVAFGIGMPDNQMFPAAPGIFMFILFQDLGFPGWMSGSYSRKSFYTWFFGVTQFKNISIVPLRLLF
jgi:hypothetical protein